MAAFISTELYQWTAYINHGDNGWSESFYLRDQTRAGALATAALLLEARSWILGANCVIEWAEIKYLQEQPNTQAAIGDPVEPLAMWAPPDNDTIGLFFRYQTGTGKYAKHIFRGIADDEITDNKWTRAPLTLPAGIFPRPVNPDLATKDDLFRYWLTLTREKTCHAEFLANLPPFGNVWKLTPWAYVVYRHPSSLAYSSSFQRISGEWGDWTQSADFSYCGTVFGVERACRDTDAYAYIDGPKIVFRTYFAAPAATVFPHPTIFHGVCRFKQITNTGPPGELTGAKKTLANPSGVWEYNPGLAAGAAPGVMWTGLPSRFLGRDPIPFNPFPDTPLGYRPGCDIPVVNALRVRLDDGSVDSPDTFVAELDHTHYDLTITALHEVLIRPKIFELRDINSWRQPSGGSLERIYAAGQLTNTVSSASLVTADELLAVPLYCPPGATLNSVNVQVTVAGGAGSLLRIGIYRATSQTDLWPGPLLLASGAIDCTLTGLKTFITNALIDRNYLHWAVILANSSSPQPTVVTQSSIDYFQVWGYPDSDMSGLAGVAQTSAMAFGPLPATFPAPGASTIQTSLWIPKIGIKYASFGGGAGIIPTITNGTLNAGTWL